MVVIATSHTTSPPSWRDGRAALRGCEKARKRVLPARVVSGLLYLLLPSQLRPSSEIILEDILCTFGVFLHLDELAVVDISQILKVLDRPVVPRESAWEQWQSRLQYEP